MRRTHKYNISLQDKGKLETILDFSFSRTRGIICVAGAAFLFVALGIVIAMLTPLGSLTSGRLDENGRRDSMDAVIRVDSLKKAAEINQQYINNLLTVLNPDRTPTDSLRATGTPHEYSVDELVDPSDTERSFMARMDEKERYNLSVLAPLAAEDLDFKNICPGAIQTENSIGTPKAELLVPGGNVILSPTEATVTDVHYSPAEQGYVVILQQPKGFLTRIAGLSRVLAGQGDRVTGGMAIGYGAVPSGRNKAITYVEIWRNGTQLDPADYLLTSPDNGKND